MKDKDSLAWEMATDPDNQSFNPELLKFQPATVWIRELKSYFLKKGTYSYYTLRQMENGTWILEDIEKSIIFQQIRIPNHGFGKQLLENAGVIS
jgi:hypothetical protein